MIKIGIKDCIRCGGDHDSMGFTDLSRPADGWSHWGLCPTTGEPVMVKVGGGVHTRPDVPMKHSEEGVQQPEARADAGEESAGLRPLHKLPVLSCPRCGQEHGDMEFFALDNAPDGYDGYAACPATRQPILIDFSRAMASKKQ